jgi:hypothetical protein
VPFHKGRPANLIEVSLAAIRARVMGASFSGRPVADLPSFWQRPLVGRAMGRVIAHEIGHWFGGRDHTSGGLMKAAIDDRDLVEHTAPALPAAWTRSGAAPRLARASRCETAPHASLQ